MSLFVLIAFQLPTALIQSPFANIVPIQWQMSVAWPPHIRPFDWSLSDIFQISMAAMPAPSGSGVVAGLTNVSNARVYRSITMRNLLAPFYMSLYCT